MKEDAPKADSDRQTSKSSVLKTSVLDEKFRVGREIEQLRSEIKATVEAGTITPAERESFQLNLGLLYTQYVTLSGIE